MMKRTCLILVLMVLAVASLAQSQGPTPGPSKEGHPQQKHAKHITPDPQPTVQSTNPSITTVTPETTAHQENSKTNSNADDDNASAKWWKIWQVVSVLALIIVGAAQGLFIYLQIVHYRRIERGYVFITNVEWKPKPDGAKFHAIGGNIVEVTLFNGGKTPAILNRVLVAYALREQCPTREEIGNLNNVIPSNTVVRSGESKTGNIDITLSENQWAEMVLHRTKLLCYGKVEYADIFGKSHETGFCWECPNPQGTTLAICGNKDLNYYT